jgi:hypothetical protein
VANSTKECQTASGSSLDINSLLITPVQRVLRYPLLLKALVEVTEASHPDYIHLQTAVEGDLPSSLLFRIKTRALPFASADRPSIRHPKDR